MRINIAGAQQAEPLDFATGRCTFGPFALVSRGQAICALALGDDPDQLIAALQARFAPMPSTSPSFLATPLMQQVAAAIEDPKVERPELTPQGTPFQRQVWSALARIEAGTTVSYGALARAMQRPSAARAVAAACGRNPIAVFIPCHRVVGSRGDLVGYHWGLKYKRRLLNFERQLAAE